MRTHSFADSHVALRGAARLLTRAANRVEKLDRLFWHKVRMSRFGPDIHFAVSREVEEPFRVARCVVLHLEPFRTGLVLGWYDEGLEDPDDLNAASEALRRAVSLRKPTRKELENFDDAKLHGPGRPGGLRFGATGSGTVGSGGSQLRVVDPGDVRAGQ